MNREASVIDWSLPLVAVPVNGAPMAEAAIDRTFHQPASGRMVRLSSNAWTGQPQPGTWRFNDEGYAVAGLGPDGYDGKYRLTN
jgi:hypothetical protein